MEVYQDTLIAGAVFVICFVQDSFGDKHKISFFNTVNFISDKVRSSTAQHVIQFMGLMVMNIADMSRVVVFATGYEFIGCFDCIHFATSVGIVGQCILYPIINNYYQIAIYF